MKPQLSTSTLLSVSAALILTACGQAPTDVPPLSPQGNFETGTAPEAEADGISKGDASELLGHFVPDAKVILIQNTLVEDRVTIHFTDKTALYTADVDQSVFRVFEIKKNGKTVYRWGGVQMLAHRGAERFAPENTIASTKAAAELGAHFIEMDVRETKDGEIVVMHDDSVDRTTDGKGKIADLTLAQIKSLDAGSEFNIFFQGERVPTLREMVRACRAYGVFPDVDYKHGSLERITRILQEEGFLDGGFHAMLYSNDNDDLLAGLQFSANWFIRPQSKLGSLTLSSMVKKLHPKVVYVGEAQISKSYFRRLHKEGFITITGVLFSPILEKQRLSHALNMLPDMINNDNLPLLGQMAAERGVLAP